MTTLREEMCACAPSDIINLGISGWYDRGFDDALRDYGDYEIVQGELSANIQSARICDRVFCKDIYIGGTRLGRTGNHIKILVPPAKPVAECDQPKPEDPRKPEFRYKTALAQIVYLLQSLDPKAIQIEVLVERIARRALEEKEDDSR